AAGPAALFRPGPQQRLLADHQDQDADADGPERPRLANQGHHRERNRLSAGPGYTPGRKPGDQPGSGRIGRPAHRQTVRIHRLTPAAGVSRQAHALSHLQRRHATLLDDLETWAAGRAIAFTFRNRAISVGRVFGRCWLDLEYHSLAILTRVNRHHRRTRHMQIVRHAAETPIETDGIVTQLQV